ncbi:TPA: MarC family protein, partial [Streptococcus agalactiae]
VIFVLSGHLLFNLFGITLAALKISGGILVGIIGYKMINGIHSPTNKNLEEHKDDPMNVAVSPLAMPLLAGPGTIATAMGLSSGGLSGKLITILAFAILCVIMYVILISANEITKFLGKNAMTIITKMMGLILMTIGIEMLITGIKIGFHLT